jgi:hypothetical protein
VVMTSLGLGASAQCTPAQADPNGRTGATFRVRLRAFALIKNKNCSKINAMVD